MKNFIPLEEALAKLPLEEQKEIKKLTELLITKEKTRQLQRTKRRVLAAVKSKHAKQKSVTQSIQSR